MSNTNYKNIKKSNSHKDHRSSFDVGNKINTDDENKKIKMERRNSLSPEMIRATMGKKKKKTKVYNINESPNAQKHIYYAEFARDIEKHGIEKARELHNIRVSKE